jgi:hypothetical protein
MWAKIFGSIIPDYREHLENTLSVVEQNTSVTQSTMPMEKSEDTMPGDGDFLQVSSYMLLHAWEAFSSWRYYAEETYLLGIMLLGLYVARLGAIWDPNIRRSLAKKIVP